MTHSTMRISGNVQAATVSDIVEYYDNSSKLIHHQAREKQTYSRAEMLGRGVLRMLKQ